MSQYLNIDPAKSDWLPLAVTASASLPALSKEQEHLSAAFFSRARHAATTVDNDVLDWSFFFHKAIAVSSIELEAGQFSLLLQANQARTNNSTTARPWWDYSGDNRLLCWTLEYDHLLQHLQALLQVPVRANRIEQGTTSYQNLHYFQWSASSENQRYTGLLVLCDIGLKHFLTHTDWKPATSVAAKIPLPITLDFHASLGSFSLSELENFEAGDILLVPRQSMPERTVVAITASGENQGWLGIANHNELTIKTTFMNELRPDNTDSMENHNENGAPGSIDDLILNLTVKLGQKQFSLSELQNIQPGYVMSLSQSLTDNRLTLSVNNLNVGSGELVTLGDQLGVRVTEWNHPAVDPK